MQDNSSKQTQEDFNEIKRNLRFHEQRNQTEFG